MVTPTIYTLAYYTGTNAMAPAWGGPLAKDPTNLKHPLPSLAPCQMEANKVP